VKRCVVVALKEHQSMADRISELPDTVLCHILSYLPTTDAIATSVLSKSWKIVWRSCPSLRFDDFRYVYPHSRPYSPFIQSIHMALLLRDCHQTIQSFSLTCRFYHCDSTNVSIWIQSAVYRGVQNLDLCVINLFKLPTLVFTCKTLVVLKLNHFYIRDVTTVHLPQLKTMHLTNLTFSQHGHFAQLICASPNLEELVAVNSTFHSRADKGSFKNLPKLVRATVAKKDVPLVVVSNVRYLHLDWVIISLSLVLFLTKTGFLKILLLKLFFIFYFFLQMDDESVNIDPIREVNVFRNLIHLECSYMHYIRDWGKVVKVLKLCPKLQVFLIDKV